MRLYLFSLLALAALSARGSSLDQPFNSLDEDYPRARYIGGGISFVTGGATALAGIALQMDAKETDEILVGLVGTGLGSVMAADGFIRLFRASSAERLIPHYRNYPEGKPKQYGGDKDKAHYGEGILKEMADEGRNSRRLRGALDLLMSGCYWYLYAKGPKRLDAAGNTRGKDIYPHLIYPGAFFAVTALYRFLLSSPEEQAWEEYKSGGAKAASAKPRWEFAGGLSPESSYLAAILRF